MIHGVARSWFQLLVEPLRTVLSVWCARVCVCVCVCPSAITLLQWHNVVNSQCIAIQLHMRVDTPPPPPRYVAINIQKRALRYITNNYASSYTDLLNACNIPPMFIQRVRFLTVEVYTILNLIGPLYLHDMYIRKETAYDMRNILVLKLPIFNTKNMA